MEYDNIFMNNKDKLEEWLNKNVISYGGDLFNILMEKELISYDDIENRFPKLNEDDIESLALNGYYILHGDISVKEYAPS